MFLICPGRKLMQKSIVLAHFTRTHRVIFLYAREKIWKYIHQIISSGRFWSKGNGILFFPLSTLFIFLITCINTFMLSKLCNPPPPTKD